MIVIRSDTLPRIDSSTPFNYQRTDHTYVFINWTNGTALWDEAGGNINLKEVEISSGNFPTCGFDFVCFEDTFKVHERRLF